MISTVEQLEERLCRPSERLIAFLRGLEGDIAVIGAGGKMGPTLAMLAANAIRESGVPRCLHAVSTFSDPGLRARLESFGIQTHAVDVLSDEAARQLPDARHVIYMVGRKFGSTGAEWDTWGTNVYAAGAVSRRYRDSRIVAFSSGNIYPFMPVDSGGATEGTPPEPVGEYAMTCLGRERMFEYASRHFGTRVLQYRLNYAVELRYGVLLDVATQVWNGKPVDVTTGYANCVWQGFANEVALRSLELAASPQAILNVTGLERVSIRALAGEFGRLLDREPIIVGEEAHTALLSNASKCHALYGAPDVTLDELIEWTAHWVKLGGPTLAKPTHFQTRNGKF